jgi:hypothetical protein
MLVFRHLRFTTSKPDISAQAELATLNAAPMHIRTATLRAAATQALNGKLPKPVLDLIDVEFKFQGAPVTYMRGMHMEMVRNALRDQTQCVWAVPGSSGLQACFTVEHDLETAVQEEKAKLEARLKTRQETDQTVEGRKVKLFGQDVFNLTTPTSVIKDELQRKMEELTQATGAIKVEDLWTPTAITSIDVGADGRKSLTSNGSRGRACYVILASKAEAEWLVAATKLSHGSRLFIFGSPVQAQICRPRKQLKPTSTYSPTTPSRGRAHSQQTTAAAATSSPPSSPPAQQQQTQPTAATRPSSRSIKPTTTSSDDATQEAAAAKGPSWTAVAKKGYTRQPTGPQAALPTRSSEERHAEGDRRNHSGPIDEEQQRSLAAQGAENTTTAEAEREELLDQLLEEREQLKSTKQQEEAVSKLLLKANKKQDTYLRTQTENLKQDLEKQLAEYKAETTDRIVELQAMLKKQMKAQLDISREITDAMMKTVQGMLATMQEELMQRMEAMIHNAMAGTAAPSSVTSDDQPSKKRHKADDDDEDAPVDMNEVVASSHSVTSIGHTLSSFPQPLAGGGGGSN